MPRGRPKNGEIDRLVALSQYWYFRLSMRFDDGHLAYWLRSHEECGLTDTEGHNFLEHQSAITKKHARRIDSLVPGTFKVAQWPWRELCESRRDPGLLRESELALAASKHDRTDFDTAARQRRENPDFAPIAGAALWDAADDFFGALLEYRYEQWSTNNYRVIRLACSMLHRLNLSLHHPLLQQLKSEILFLIMRILPNHFEGVAKSEANFLWFNVINTHDVRFDTLPGRSNLRSLAKRVLMDPA